MENRSSELFPIIEEIARIGTYETDLTNGTWVGSANFVKIFGLQPKSVYDVKEFQAIVHPDDLAQVMNYFDECLKNRTDFNCQYRCMKPNGEVIFVLSRSKIYYSEDGTPLRIIGVKQDISESKLQEQQLSILIENNTRKNEVISMVAHDLQSPVSQLEAIASVLKNNLNHEQIDLVLLQEEICRSARRTIKELIEIAELEDKAYVLKKVNVNINDLILNAIHRFELPAKEKKISLRTKLCRDGEALINADIFSRAIDNLISNAIKFSPEEKSVDIITESNTDKFSIRIIDEGIGIKRELLPSIFERFSKTTRRKGTLGEHSNGLGLSIVKNIIDLHKGTISVDSIENNGTTFMIELPRER